jgi:3D (Asp-Asp-Asp) domain-containing protein
MKPAPTVSNPQPSLRSTAFVATAYCVGTVTATGTLVANGTVAADPTVLPLGTKIRVTGVPRPYEGIYTVRDTGPNIRGHRVDVYVASCAQARRFGRRSVQVSVLRTGVANP